MKTDAGNADQIAMWNGPSGDHWVKSQERQDQVLAPVSTALFARAAAQPGEHVMDIGCGCGGTSIDLAHSVGPSGRVLGLDVSEAMLMRARERTPRDAPIEFVLADATVHPFAPATYDLLVSRFGVMFFADPVASFANMRRGLRSGGRIAFACWRAARDNPWLMTPLQAVFKHVPRPAPPAPDEPGQFAFADTARVQRILEGAGFASIDIVPCDLSFDMARGGGLDAAIQAATDFGPSHRLLKDATPAVKDAVRSSVREALAPLVVGNSVPLAAGIWIVTAANP